MKKSLLAILSPWLVSTGLAAQTGRAAPESARSIPFATLARHAVAAPSSPAFNMIVLQYCVVCHNDVAKTGNLTLQTFDIEAIVGSGEKTETAEKMIRKLRACNAHRLASDDTYEPRACGGDTK